MTDDRNGGRTTEEDRTRTNKGVFDEFVEHILTRSGISVIGEPIEHLLETIESGEAMAETALNMIATAHVAYMFTDVFSPYDEPEWTERLKQLRPRIERALRACPDLLEDYLVDDDKDNAPPLGSYFSDGWEVYREYDISSPGKEASRGLLQYGFIFDLLFQSQRDNFRAEGSEDANTYLGFLARFRKMLGWTTLTWHRHLTSAAIRELLDSPRTLKFFEWCAIVDMCAALMASAKEKEDDWHDDTYPNSDPDISVTSPQHWAWEFGQVAATWPLIKLSEDEMDYGVVIDAFIGWPSGFIAKALAYEAQLLARPVEPIDREDIGWAEIYTGLTYGGSNAADHGAMPRYPHEFQSGHQNYWLMRLGLLNGFSKLEREWRGQWAENRPPEQPSVADSATPPAATETANNMLMVGPSSELGQAVIRAMEEVQRQRAEQNKSELVESLGELWEQLPQDAREYLTAAQQALSNGPANSIGASIGFATAVEVALEDFLQPPRGQRDWPGPNIGEWCDVLRKMRETDKAKRHRFDEVVRRQFDAEYASALAAALDVLRDRRVRDAHHDTKPPRPQQVRDTVLGKAGGPSIFELILRFARNWPPKRK